MVWELCPLPPVEGDRRDVLGEEGAHLVEQVVRRLQQVGVAEKSPGSAAGFSPLRVMGIPPSVVTM